MYNHTFAVGHLRQSVVNQFIASLCPSTINVCSECDKLSIRSLIQLFLAATIIAAAFSINFQGSTPLSAQVDCNPIYAENQKPGTDDWQLTNPANDRVQQIKGYGSATSVNLGDTIDFHITVDQPQTYSIDIFRMGWYGGLGGRLVMQVGPRDGVVQPGITLANDTGLIIAPWRSSYQLRIPDDWVTGVYLAKLTNANGYQNYIVFTVRDESRAGDILYQQSVTTDQAYNNYPDDKERGKSLYASGSYGDVTIGGDERAVKVSFDRPYARDGSGLFFEWEHNLIRWLEREGYDVSYSTNIDTHLNGERLKEFKAFISPGHDEYWSKEMRDKVEEARDSGVNLAFFGANAAFEQIRFEDPETRVITAYKNWNLDPNTDPETKTVTWRQIYEREEQRLIGIQYISYNSWPDTNTDYVIENSDHWVYEGAGFSDGDKVEGIIGYEVDQLFEDVPLPDNLSYDILSTSPYFTSYQTWVDAQSSIYQAPSGAWVFAAGTMSWSWGLDRPGIEHEGLKRTTSNILNRFVGQGTTPCTDEEPTATPVPPTATALPTNTPVPTETPTPIPPTSVPATASPTATVSSVAPSTNTPVPTSTEPSASPVPIETSVPAATAGTATSTPSPTGTSEPSVTNTPVGTGAEGGVVTGRLFDDINRDGNYEDTEPAFGGIAIHLVEVGSAGQRSDFSTLTDEDGVYSFFNLPDADYQLIYVLPSDYNPTGKVTNQMSTTGVGQVEDPLLNNDRLYLPVVN